MSWQDYPTLKLLIQAAKKLEVDYQIVGKLGFVRFQKGPRLAYVYRTKTSLNSYVSVYLSESKYLASKILQEAGLPSPTYRIFSNPSSVLKAARNLGFPLVVKPNIGSQGNGVTANINSEDELLVAVELAQKFHHKTALSPFFPGEDYRLLVLNHELIAAIKRRPPKIKGDSQRTIRALIRQENQKRKCLNQTRFVPLMMIKIDQETKRCLHRAGLKLTSILPLKKTLFLRTNANWSSGGTATTLNLDEFHPEIKKAAIKANQLLGLRFAGLDFIIKDIQKPLAKGNGIILEINSAPAIGVFHQPASGEPQKVAQRMLKAMLA